MKRTLIILKNEPASPPNPVIKAGFFIYCQFTINLILLFLDLYDRVFLTPDILNMALRNLYSQAEKLFKGNILQDIGRKFILGIVLLIVLLVFFHLSTSIMSSILGIITTIHINYLLVAIILLLLFK